ncbi:MAG: hypothetical protein IPL90_00740 [Holophagales bacterium]|nr:hypothetical protein [Holophagales bacterium]
MSMPIENVVCAIRPVGTPRSFQTGWPTAFPFQSQSAMSRAATTWESPPATSSARSSHARCSHGERPAQAAFTFANAASPLSQLWP